MSRRNRTQRPLLIALALGVTLLTAWSIGHEPLVESAPMSTLLEEAASTGDVAVTWDLTVTRNERVEDWIDFLKGRNAERTHLWLERSGRYGPMIQAELRSRGMPQDLLYLALIESGFSPKAHSRAAAVGIWQFIEETGERYGLEVSEYVDERRDPVESTDAALDYLQELYERFGSWYLAAASYNTGENRVDRILREQKGGARGDDGLFWEIARFLPQETRDYVPLMLAAGHIAKEPEKYGFAGLSYQDPLDFDAVWVPGESSFELIAQAAGVAVEDVADLNPHLIRGTTPPGRGWSVRIPKGSEDRFSAAFPDLYRLARAEESRPAEKVAAGRTHRMKRGETLSHLANRYGVSVSAIRAANGNISPQRVRAGQVLAIPTASSTPRVASATATTKVADTRYHRVRAGESLWTIARRYDVSVTQLQAWNDMGRRSTIRSGQRLRVSA
jgi:membrane-bound lytic murein transglycosylase D